MESFVQTFDEIVDGSCGSEDLIHEIEIEVDSDQVQSHTQNLGFIVKQESSNESVEQSTGDCENLYSEYEEGNEDDETSKDFDSESEDEGEDGEEEVDDLTDVCSNLNMEDDLDRDEVQSRIGEAPESIADMNEVVPEEVEDPRVQSSEIENSLFKVPDINEYKKKCNQVAEVTVYECEEVLDSNIQSEDNSEVLDSNAQYEDYSDTIHGEETYGTKRLISRKRGRSKTKGESKRPSTVVASKKKIPPKQNVKQKKDHKTAEESFKQKLEFLLSMKGPEHVPDREYRESFHKAVDLFSKELLDEIYQPKKSKESSEGKISVPEVKVVVEKIPPTVLEKLINGTTLKSAEKILKSHGVKMDRRKVVRKSNKRPVMPSLVSGPLKSSQDSKDEISLSVGNDENKSSEEVVPRQLKCIVYSCGNTPETCNRFFPIPFSKGFDHGMEWYKVCTREYPPGMRPRIPSIDIKENCGYLIVCEEHFPQDEMTLIQAGPSKGKYKLKKGTLPSQKLTSVSSEELQRSEHIPRPIAIPPENEHVEDEILSVQLSGLNEETAALEKSSDAVDAQECQNEELSEHEYDLHPLQTTFSDSQPERHHVPKRDVAIQFPSISSLSDDLKSEEELLRKLSKVQVRSVELELYIPLLEEKIVDTLDILRKLHESHPEMFKSRKLKALAPTPRNTNFMKKYNSHMEKLERLQEQLKSAKKEKEELQVNPFNRKIDVDCLTNFFRQKILDLLVENTKQRQEIKEVNAELKRCNTYVAFLKQSYKRLKQRKLERKVYRQDVVKYLKNICSTAMMNFLFGISSNTKNFPAKNWKKEEIINAILLRNISSHAFNFARTKKMMPLPSVETMKTWLPDLQMKSIFDIKHLKDSQTEEIQRWIPDHEHLEYLKLKRIEAIETLKFQRQELEEEQKELRKRKRISEKVSKMNQRTSDETANPRQNDEAMSPPAKRHQASNDCETTKKVEGESQSLHEITEETIIEAPIVDSNAQPIVSESLPTVQPEASNQIFVSLSGDQLNNGIQSIILDQEITEEQLSSIPISFNQVQHIPSSSSANDVPIISHHINGQDVHFIRLCPTVEDLNDPSQSSNATDINVITSGAGSQMDNGVFIGNLDQIYQTADPGTFEIQLNEEIQQDEQVQYITEIVSNDLYERTVNEQQELGDIVHVQPEDPEEMQKLIQRRQEDLQEQEYQIQRKLLFEQQAQQQKVLLDTQKNLQKEILKQQKQIERLKKMQNQSKKKKVAGRKSSSNLNEDTAQKGIISQSTEGGGIKKISNTLTEETSATVEENPISNISENSGEKPKEGEIVLEASLAEAMNIDASSASKEQSNDDDDCARSIEDEALIPKPKKASLVKDAPAASKITISMSEEEPAQEAVSSRPKRSSKKKAKNKWDFLEKSNEKEESISRTSGTRIGDFVIDINGDPGEASLDLINLKDLERHINQHANMSGNNSSPILVPTVINGVIKHIMLRPVSQILEREHHDE